MNRSSVFVLGPLGFSTRYYYFFLGNPASGFLIIRFSAGIGGLAI